MAKAVSRRLVIVIKAKLFNLISTSKWDEYIPVTIQSARFQWELKCL